MEKTAKSSKAIFSANRPARAEILPVLIDISSSLRCLMNLINLAHLPAQGNLWSKQTHIQPVEKKHLSLAQRMACVCLAGGCVLITTVGGSR